MKRKIVIIVIVAIGFLGFVTLKYFRGLAPSVLPPSVNIADVIENRSSSGETLDDNSSAPAPATNETGFPLKLRDGFSISIVAKDLNKPRVVKQDLQGNLWVSELGAGSITHLRLEHGKETSQDRVFSNLRRPHGLAFDPENPHVLYFAEEDAISKVDVYSSGYPKVERLVKLPAGGRHFSRTIEFGPDGRLYVAIGSNCDTCIEGDARRAAVYPMNNDGSDFRLFAKGLRNTVFFTWNPSDGKMWGTDMGRDFLGDDLPPDEINIIEQDKNYGWPICYGKNNHDTTFDKNTYIRNPCMEPFETPSHIDLPAHSAPLGLAFIPKNSAWPKDYWGDLLVAYHGSWNRSEPTGYKIVRIKLDDNGNEEGSEDFISGWLDNDRSSGRPVDLLILPEGVMYVTDDKAGVVYRVTYQSS